jgi:hypothetical protein
MNRTSFHAEIAADITTRNPERKDIWQDKTLDITMLKYTQKHNKTWDLKTTGGRQNEHRFHSEITTDITTQYQESKDT